MNNGCQAIFVNYLVGIFTLEQTTATFRPRSLQSYLIAADKVENSRFSCSSLASDQKVMPTANKMKNFRLFVSEGFAHDVNTQCKIQALETSHAITSDDFAAFTSIN